MKNAAHVLGKEMLNFLESKDLSVEDCIGKCYDGTLNMMPEKKEVAFLYYQKPSSSHYTLQLAQFKFSVC